MTFLEFIESDRDLSTAMAVQYDFGLIVLSVVVAIVASFTGFLLSERIRSTDLGWQRSGWLIAGSLALGGGMWVMHFVGMSALKMTGAIKYDIFITAVSIVPSVFASLIVLLWESYHQRSMLKLVIRGVLMGGGIGVMHYTGMAAMRMDGEMRYDPFLFLLSIVVAVVLAIVSLRIKQWAEDREDRYLSVNQALAIASVVMGGAISGMHYTAMAGVYLFPGHGSVDSAALDGGAFALPISLLIGAVLILLVIGVYVSRRLELLGELAAKETRLQTIFDTVADGLITLDAKGRIESFNPAAEKIFGYASKELIGKNINILMPEPHLSRHDDYLRNYLSTGEVKVIGASRELEGRRKDGSVFPIALAVNVATIMGKPLFVGVVSDITYRKFVEEVLQQAKIDAEAANQAKSSFLATMSHEIRTPMNGVIGMIDVLAVENLSASQSDMLATIKNSAFSLLDVINDILDFSKIESGELTLEQIPTSIEEVVEGVCDTLMLMAYKKNIDLIVFVSPEIPASILTDPIRLRQVLLNLVGNAIKFTANDSGDSGRVFVRAELEVISEGRGEILFQVGDNGIGMTQEVRSSLFQPFSQGEGSITRRFGGTGLGLSISLRLIENMGGYIDVESEPGIGSLFSVYLPFEEAPAEATSDVIDLTDLCAVLVNCGEMIGGILGKYLENAGVRIFNLDSTDNVNQLVQQLVPVKKQLVVVIECQNTDAELQSTRQKLREAMSKLDPVFVVMTRGRRQAPRPDADDSYMLDMDAMHRKVFLNTIAIAAGRAPLESVIARQADVTAASLSVDDAKAARKLILMAEDNEVNQKVLTHQLNMSGYAVEVANDGRQALEMWRTGRDRYSIILTDCHMPEMDGYELARTIRQEENDGDHITIIAITADAVIDTRKKCLDNDMDDYITKPMQLHILRDKLTEWLADEVRVIADAQTENRPEVVDQSVLKGILGVDDKAMMADFFADFISNSEKDVEAILSAGKSKEAKTIGEIGHRLKSSARAIGANALADCCQNLEQAGKTENSAGIELGINQLPRLYQEVRDWVRK